MLSCGNDYHQDKEEEVPFPNVNDFFCTSKCCVVSLGSKQYSASIAFTLALFSHLVNHVNIRLQAELEEAESQVPPLHTDATGERGNPCLHVWRGKGTNATAN